MIYEDEVEEGEEVVRSFMITRGRTRASVEELAIETRVSATTAARLNARSLSPEQRRILLQAVEPISIAEISALLEIPLRAVIVMVSEMAEEGTLVADSTVEVVDTTFLSRIRSAFEAL